MLQICTKIKFDKSDGISKQIERKKEKKLIENENKKIK